VAETTADSAENFVGKIVGWDFLAASRSKNIPFVRFVQALMKQGVEDPRWLPEPASDSDCLKRAVADIVLGRCKRDREDYETKVRTHRQERLKDGGWSIMRLRDKRDAHGKADVSLDTEQRVWLDGDDALHFEPDDGAMVPEIKTRFRYYQAHLHPDDLSAFLIYGILKSRDRMPGERAFGVLRRKGGTYFVPKPGVALWGRIVAAIH